MRIKKLSGFFSLTLITVLFIIVCSQFLWGKLFAFSPVKLGFEKFELKNIIVYVQNRSAKYNFASLDTLTKIVENAHGLSFTEKPELFFFRDSNSYLNRTITRARFYAYPNGCLMISPWAVRESSRGVISMSIYVRHELSHILLYQHMGLLTAYFYFPRWLLEGIAVYTSGQMGTSWYPGKSETYADIRSGAFLPLEYFNTHREDDIKINLKNKTAFTYSEFACIVDYLIVSKGKENFNSFIRRLLTGSKPYEIFKSVYKISFTDFLEDFKMHVKNSYN